jgi:hypothetical protein
MKIEHEHYNSTSAKNKDDTANKKIWTKDRKILGTNARNAF